MKQTINKTIKEIHQNHEIKIDYHNYEGFLIVFEDDTELFLGIDMDSSCCESYNYLTTHDCIDSFIGEKVKSITFIEDTQNTKGKEKHKKTAIEGIDADMGYECYKEDLYYSFVNIQTSKDMLQLVVYNHHNGYYPHSAIFVLGDELTETKL